MEPFAVCYKAFGRDFYIEPASIQHANAVFQDEYRISALRQHEVRTIVDIGAHVGSFTVLCHQYWPAAKIVAVEPHPESFALLQKDMVHKATSDQRSYLQYLRHDAVIILRLPQPSRRVRPGLWVDLEERPGHFGVEVPAMTTAELWKCLKACGFEQIDLLKLDCEGAEYSILSELNRLDLLSTIGWIRGEWHCRNANSTLEQSLAATHSLHIDFNKPHDVGLFAAHRYTAD